MTAPPFYLIRISGIEASASIGIHGFEQAARQKLLVSVALLLELPKAGDEIAGVADYDFVREGVLRLVSERHFNLQETLCWAVLDLCLAQKGVLGAVVQTDKPDVYPGVAGSGLPHGADGFPDDRFPLVDNRGLRPGQSETLSWRCSRSAHRPRSRPATTSRRKPALRAIARCMAILSW